MNTSPDHTPDTGAPARISRKFDKLVRDRIPEIIESRGETAVTYVASDAEYSRRLREKLQEEVAEFLSADHEHAPEELADILEVIQAICAEKNIGYDDLEKLRQKKAEERGGFGGKIILTETY